MNKKTLLIVGLIAASVVLAGCTHIADKPTTSSNSTDMNHDMSMMHMADSEEQFITNMIPHHQEAVDSAKIILAHSTNADMKRLAQDIVDAQTKEISMMQ